MTSPAQNNLNFLIWISRSNKIFNIRKAAGEQHLWTFGKCLWGQCPVLSNCHQVCCWIWTWLNIAWRWHSSWTANRSDHWWLLPCCRKAGDGQSMTETPGDSHGSEHFIWQGLEYFAWTFGFKQGPCQMGPMFSDTRSEVISGGNMFGAVGYLHCNPGQRVVLYNNWWWNMDSPLGLRHQTGVDVVETCQLSSTQEVLHSTSVGKSWPQFSGITKACCWWITYHRIQRLDHTTVKCWQICVRQWMRGGGECWPEVRCCCTIMLWCTCLELHRP